MGARGVYGIWGHWVYCYMSGFLFKEQGGAVGAKQPEKMPVGYEGGLSDGGNLSCHYRLFPSGHIIML